MTIYQIKIDIPSSYFPQDVIFDIVFQHMAFQLWDWPFFQVKVTELDPTVFSSHEFLPQRISCPELPQLLSSEGIISVIKFPETYPSLLIWEIKIEPRNPVMPPTCVKARPK